MREKDRDRDRDRERMREREREREEGKGGGEKGDIEARAANRKIPIMFIFTWEGVREGITPTQADQFLIHFSICACHPCAGAMLIFSVSFQFYRMIPGFPASDF